MLAVFLFGISGLFGKLVDCPAIIITLGRVFFATVALLIILIYGKKKIKLDSGKDYFYLIVSGIILAFHWTAFFYSIQLSTVAIGLLTYSTFPVFTTFLEPYFFKEKFQPRNMLVALIAFAGIALVIPEYDFGSNMTKGAIWGILSGFSFALLQTMNRKFVANYSSLTVTFYQVGTASIVLLPFIFLYPITYSMNDMLLLVLLGIVFTAFAHSLFIKGLNTIKVQTASIIASLEPIYGILFAVILFSEIPSLRSILGGAIIIIASIYVSMKSEH
jgi:drug/metabolite transporter (DMT)-like permease